MGQEDREYTRPVPSRLKRYYGNGDLHFITFSCYRRMQLLSARRRDSVLRQLESLRIQYRFVVVGYVIMPEHVHLLLSEPERRDVSIVIKALKQAVARMTAHTSKTGSCGAPPIFLGPDYLGHPPGGHARSQSLQIHRQGARPRNRAGLLRRQVLRQQQGTLAVAGLVGIAAGDTVRGLE